MIPARNSGKSENGGWGGLSRGCITIESCTKWKKRKTMKGEKKLFHIKMKKVQNSNCMKIAAKKRSRVR